jgi:Protein of unknown function (DUF2905)
VKGIPIRFYFPIVTPLIISVVLSLILWLLNRRADATAVLV